MKLTLLLLLFGSVLSAGAVAQQPGPPAVVPVESATWSNAAPPDAGFTVMMPGKPAEQSSAVAGRPDIENHLLMLETSLAGYVVSYVQFPDEISDPAAIKEMLDRGRQGGLESSKAELKSEKEIKLNGYFGREWVMALPGDLTATARAYWVKRRLYQTVFVAKVVAGEPAAASKLRQDAETRFLDSFALLGNASQ